MIALICATVNIAIIVRCFLRKESIFYPVCLLNLMWLAVHMMNLVLGWNSDEAAYLILLLPSLFFSVGFVISDKTRLLPNTWKFLIQKIKDKSSVCKKILGWIATAAGTIKAFGKKNLDQIRKRKTSGGHLQGMRPTISTGVLTVVVVVFAFYAYEFLSRLGMYNDGNVWYAFRVITWEHHVNDIFVYKYSSLVAFLLPSVLLISAQKSKKKTELCKFIVSLVVAIIWSVLRTSRTSTFSIVIIMVMTQILLMERNNTKKLNSQERVAIRKKKMGIFAVAVVFILAIFLYVALQKETNSYGDVSVFEFFLKSLANYTNLSSAAFVEWYKQGVTHTYGSNSFRFVIAVLYKLGIITTLPAANSGGLFITFEGLRTNAFTVARAYVEDFGVLYMAVMMMIFGLVHGAVYSKARRSKGLIQVRYALINAMLDIPLFFQILTNQYLNVLSGWIQYVIWICLFTWPLLWTREVSDHKKRQTENRDQIDTL